LGIKNLFFAGLPDNRFDNLDLLEIVKLVEKYIEQLHPERIYTHHAYDLNLDHQITFQAVLTACRPQQGCPVKELLCFETPSSTEWQAPAKEKVFVPNVFVDISLTIELKKKALAEYVSELRNYPHPRSVEGIEIIANRWGLVVGKKFVEAFELIRMIED
jgi:LmbE family N-acetylglucosaminyl deacetylase